MEDAKIKQLFSDFNPDISSNVRFMSALRSRMNSVEMVKLHTAERRRRSKIAVMLSALAGFAAGVLLTLLMPYVTAYLAEWHPHIPDMVSIFRIDLNISFVRAITDHLTILAWTLAGIITVLTTLKTYSLSMSLLRTEQRTK